MKTLADLKRTLVPGVKLVMTHHSWGGGVLIGQVRSISKVQGNCIYLHTINASNEMVESRMEFPKAKNLTFEGSDTFTVCFPSDGYGTDCVMTYDIIREG